MIFEFVENGIDLYDLAIKAYNLALLYFYWDLGKFFVKSVITKLRRRL